jgi:predicted dehydrogenase
MSRLRVGVVGVGYLGRFHAQKFAAADAAELVGVCDLDAAAGQAVAAETDCSFFGDHRALAVEVDAVSIAASTTAHFDLCRYFLEHGRHVLVEKPMTQTSAQAAELNSLADKHGVVLQVGHIERFNPALLAARKGLEHPSFIECHRLAPFKARGVDVDVVLDLMIHDLDVTLSLIDAAPVSVSAVGIAVLTGRVDVANTRIEFDNGAIANLTASRASTKSERKFRVWQDQHYVSIDFGRGTINKVRSVADWRGDGPPLEETTFSLDKGDALRAEIDAFVAAARGEAPCVVSGRDGLAALELAEWIIADVERRRASDRVV